MTIVVFLQVFFRFVVKGSLPWSEELARYLMVWATFIGAGLAAADNAHIGVEFFVKLFGPKASKFFLTIAYLIVLFTSLALLNYSFIIIQYQFATGQLSPAMAIPMTIPYLALPVGFIYMAICFTIAYWRNMKSL
ncbi:TRAP transporter small permease [Desulfallas sp. Bu1-1]|nr:TRAP transporter small permease [Desulfallas sp. Bu1-1]